MGTIIAIIILLIVLIIIIIGAVRKPDLDDDRIENIEKAGVLIGTFDDFDKIERIEADYLDLIVNLNDGPSKINVFGKNDKIQEEEYFEIDEVDNVIKLNTLKPASKATSDWIRLEITLPNLEEVEVVFKEFKGVLDINNKLGSLSINNLNGVLTVDTETTFDIDIDNIQGVTDLEFDNKDAEFNLERITGAIDIESRKEIADGAEGSSYNEVFGNARDKINIRNISGAVEID